MERIDAGVRRFQRVVYGRMSHHFEQLAQGQSPETLFITCSDSRVDPALITQAEPGELFVVRNAGNLVPRWGTEVSIDAAVEYAVAVLGVRDIVVCGHSSCGAIGGLLQPESLTELPSVRDWVRHAEPAAAATAHLCGHERVAETIATSAAMQLDNLMTHPSVARAVSAGDLSMHAWVYDIGTGHIERLLTRGVAA